MTTEEKDTTELSQETQQQDKNMFFGIKLDSAGMQILEEAEENDEYKFKLDNLLLSIRISPFWYLISPMINFIIVDLPDPDSPTKAIEEFLLILNDKSSIILLSSR